MPVRRWGPIATVVLLVALAAAGNRPRDPDTLVIGIGTDPGSLDPARVSGVPEGRILRALFEGLTTLDPETLEPLPGAAGSWEISEDRTTYRFHLRPGLRWSNGDALTSEDFRTAWLRLLDPATGAPYASLLWPVRGARSRHAGEGSPEDVAIRCPDPMTLEVELDRPVPHFLPLTAFYPLSPVHRTSVEASGGSALLSPDRLVSNGPYRLEGRWLRDRVRVVRNEAHRDAARVAIPRIDFLAAEAPTTLLNLFLTGEADWVTRVPRDVIPTLIAHPEYTRVYRSRPYFETAFYRVNATRPPWNDPAVRAALSLALDRAELCRSVTRAGERPAWSFVPWPQVSLTSFPEGTVAPLPDYDRACITTEGIAPAGSVTPDRWDALGYDPVRARATLAAAGYRVPGTEGGRALPPLEILFNTSPLHQRAAEWIQDAWHRELGIEVRLRNLEFKSALDAQSSLDFDVSRSSWVGDYLDPMTFLEVFATGSSTSRTGWSDEEYDRLLAAAAAMPAGDARNDVLHRAEAILLERGPVLPLWYGVTTALVSERLRGLGSNALDHQWPARLSLEGPP